MVWTEHKEHRIICGFHCQSNGCGYSAGLNFPLSFSRHFLPSRHAVLTPLILHTKMDHAISSRATLRGYYCSRVSLPLEMEWRKKMRWWGAALVSSSSSRKNSLTSRRSTCVMTWEFSRRGISHIMLGCDRKSQYGFDHSSHRYCVISWWYIFSDKHVPEP